MNEDFLGGNSSRLVTLNTRITEEAYFDLEIIRGFLQTTGQIRKITKQDAVDWAIKYAYFEVNKQMEANGTINVNYTHTSHSDPIQTPMKTIPKHSERKKRTIRNPFRYIQNPKGG